MERITTEQFIQAWRQLDASDERTDKVRVEMRKARNPQPVSEIDPLQPMPVITLEFHRERWRTGTRYGWRWILIEPVIIDDMTSPNP